MQVVVEVDRCVHFLVHSLIGYRHLLPFDPLFGFCASLSRSLHWIGVIPQGLRQEASIGNRRNSRHLRNLGIVTPVSV
jgi:hypothetical protein